MPPDACPAVDASLAPSQIYIIFAITLTTFAWLLKPEAFGQLSGRQLLVGVSLVFYQVAHVVLYVAIQQIGPEINVVVHGIALAGYLVAAAWLFRTRWIEAKDRPPSNPDDDSAGV